MDCFLILKEKLVPKNARPLHFFRAFLDTNIDIIKQFAIEDTLLLEAFVHFRVTGNSVLEKNSSLSINILKEKFDSLSKEKQSLIMCKLLGVEKENLDSRISNIFSTKETYSNIRSETALTKKVSTLKNTVVNPQAGITDPEETIITKNKGTLKVQDVKTFELSKRSKPKPVLSIGTDASSSIVAIGGDEVVKVLNVNSWELLKSRDYSDALGRKFIKSIAAGRNMIITANDNFGFDAFPFRTHTKHFNPHADTTMPRYINTPFFKSHAKTVDINKEETHILTTRDKKQDVIIWSINKYPGRLFDIKKRFVFNEKNNGLSSPAILAKFSKLKSYFIMANKKQLKQAHENNEITDINLANLGIISNIHTFDLNPSAESMAILCTNKYIYFVDINKQEIIGSHEISPVDGICIKDSQISYSPDGKYLAIAYIADSSPYTNFVKIIDTKTATSSAIFENWHREEITNILFLNTDSSVEDKTGKAVTSYKLVTGGNDHIARKTTLSL